MTGGNVTFSGGTQTFSGTYDVAGTTTVDFSATTFAAASTVTSIGSALDVSGGTLTLSSGDTIAPTTLTQTSGTITGSDPINVSGLTTFNGGVQSGTGTTTTSGGVEFGGAAFKTISRAFTIPNGQSADFIGTGGMAVNSPGILTNAGTWDHQTDADISGTGTIANPGTFNRTTSAGLLTISCTFHNTGSVDVQSGEMSLSGSGTDTGDYDCGGAILSFGGGTRSMSTATAVTGTEVHIDAGTLTINATWNVTAKTLFEFPTVTFTNQATITDIGSNLEVIGGTVTFNSGETVAPDTFDFRGGTVTGSDDMAISGLFTWESGSHEGSGDTVASGGIALTATSFLALERHLTNAIGSTAVYSGPGSLQINSPGVLTNAGTWDHQSDGSMSGSGTFDNEGTFLRTTSADVLLVQCRLDSAGTIDVQTGEFHPAGGGTWSGSADCTGTKIIFGAGTYDMTLTSSITGTEVEFQFSDFTSAGTYNVTSATRFVGGDAAFVPASTITSVGSTLEMAFGTASFSSGDTITVTNLDFTGGTLTGSDNVVVTGPFDWNAGAMTGAGTTTAQGGMTIDTNGVSLGRTLINGTGSTAVMSGTGGIFFQAGGSIVNQVGATFEIQNDAFFSDPGTSTILNAGTWLRTTSNGTFETNIPMVNTGTVEVRTGVLDVGAYSQTAGSTFLNGGNIAVDSDDVMTISGGVLRGSGTIDGDVVIGNGPGTVSPGVSAGTIGATQMTFGPDGTYACEIGGLTPGTQHDLLGGPTSGAYAVNGTLSVTLIGGFVPAIGNTFTIVQGSSRTGNFATTSLPPLPDESEWVVTYTATTVVLSVAPPTNADLAVTNTDAPDPVSAGGDVTYTVTVTNGGPDPATNVTLTDALHASTSFVSATPSQGTCSHAAGTVTCPLGNIANGATATITIVATTSAGSVPSITNTATADGTEADLTPGNDTAIATTTVNPIADLSITKSDTPDPVAAAGTITYTLDVSNAGPNDVGSIVTVTDTLPGGVAFDSATGTGWTCGHVAPTVTCTRASLAVGAAPAITITVTAPGSPGPISNSCSVSASVSDPVPGNNADTAGTNVTAVADVSITKGDAPDPVNASTTLTYTLDVSNAGPSSASTVSVVDTLPAGVAFVSASGTGWTCGHVSGTVTCTRPTLAVTAAPAITITATAPAEGGSITNNASVTAAEFDPTAANNAASTSTTVTPVADLSITKSDSPDPANVSSPLAYTIQITNLGPSTANNLTVTDNLPAGVGFVAAAGSGWTCGEAAGAVTCTRPALAAGVAPAITINVTTPASPGVISNTGTVSAASPNDPAPGNNTDTETTSVAVVTADVSITKGDAPDPVNAGATLTYTLNVGNAGPDPATSVTVVDDLPAGAAFGSATGTGWTCVHAAGVVTCTRASLAVGAAPAITISVTAPSAAGTITNTAAVTAAEADNNTANNTASAQTTVAPVANLSITKTDGSTTYTPGETVTYTIVAANAGPSGVVGATVADTFDARLTGVTWTCAGAGGGTCPASGSGNINASVALPSGASVTFTATGSASATATGSLTNTATVAVPAGASDPVPANNTATDTDTASIVADLAIVKTASSPTVAATALYSYTLAVSNAGPSQAGTVTVTDPLPSGVVFQSATGTGWTCSHASGTVTCTRSSLAVGAAPAITINVRAPNAAGTPNNTATVATSGDPVAGNNTSSAAVTITAAADLRLSKTTNVSQIVDGSNVTYTISVRNLGPSTATNVVVTDPLPSEATLVSATGNGWTCGLDRGLAVVVCTRPSIGIATAPNITIVATMNTFGKGGTICNTATVESDASDPVTSDNTDQVCVNGVPQGVCGTLSDLLVQVQDGDIPTGRKTQWEKYLRTTIQADNLGQRNVVVTRLATFSRQVHAAEAQGAIDSETADSLSSCSESLRQQALASVQKKTTRRR
jgi:uncharacterized repeat protein (TIGR01451 family)